MTVPTRFNRLVLLQPHYWHVGRVVRRQWRERPPCLFDFFMRAEWRPGAAGDLIQATLGSVRFVPRPRIMLRMIDLERLTIEFAGHCREDQANAFVDLAVC